jgi:hypothetical protein
MPTITIPLTQGQVAVIDAADLSIIASHKWYALLFQSGKWYAYTKSIRPDGRRWSLAMHRLIVDAPDSAQVDHVDLDTLNNRRSNLRIATRSQNGANRSALANNQSGYKGVYRRGKYLRWSASIRQDGRLLHIGRYASPEDAARAYDAKARELFGEFARCNFPA